MAHGDYAAPYGSLSFRCLWCFHCACCDACTTCDSQRTPAASVALLSCRVGIRGCRCCLVGWGSGAVGVAVTDTACVHKLVLLCSLRLCVCGVFVCVAAPALPLLPCSLSSLQRAPRTASTRCVHGCRGCVVLLPVVGRNPTSHHTMCFVACVVP